VRRHIQAEGDEFSIADVPRAGEEKQLARVLWHCTKHPLKSADIDRGPEPGPLLVGEAFWKMFLGMLSFLRILSRRLTDRA